MAEDTVNQLTAKEIEEAGRVKPYTFHRAETENINLPGSSVMSFIGRVSDVSNGVEQVLELLMWDEKRRNNVDESDRPELEQQPVLTAYNRGALMRFACTSLDMLDRECDRMREWAFEYHTPEGRIERYEQALCSLKSHRQPVPVPGK